MVHSGGASGGHYFAIVKDFSTGSWLKLNGIINIQLLGVKVGTALKSGFHVLGDLICHFGLENETRILKQLPPSFHCCFCFQGNAFLHTGREDLVIRKLFSVYNSRDIMNIPMNKKNY